MSNSASCCSDSVYTLLLFYKIKLLFMHISISAVVKQTLFSKFSFLRSKTACIIIGFMLFAFIKVQDTYAQITTVFADAFTTSQGTTYSTGTAIGSSTTWSMTRSGVD